MCGARSREDFAASVVGARKLFVEFLGPEEDLLWFGTVINYGLLQEYTPSGMSPENAQHRRVLLENLGVSYGLSCSRDGLLTSSGGFTKRLSSTAARSGALLFDPESLYRGALYAAALATLALTNGSRLAELLQVSADRFRVRPYQMRKDGNSTQVERIMHLQW